MIDVHSHILPGLDDGPQSLEEALQMCALACADGIETIVATPHMLNGIYEVRQKEALDWPLAAAAVALHLDGGTVKGAAVVLGHVAPVPWPSPKAEQTLAGQSISEEIADAAGNAAVSKATPLSKNGYKVQLARVAVKRAVLRAAKGGA